MRIHDVSLRISPEMLTWPTDPGVSIERVKHLDTDGSNVSEIRFGSHTGTHVDPPLHFLADGAPVDELTWAQLIGPCRVVDLRDADRIGPEELDRLPLAGVERMLFRTRNSEIWSERSPAYPDSYVAVTPEGADWIAGRGMRLVGTDFLSIERADAAEHPVHRTLLSAGVVIVEGLDLSRIEPGDYELWCLPLRIRGGDGAPARVVLIER